MFCYNCGCRLSGHDFCTSCGADVALYKKVIHVSNMYYNEGLEKASVRDLSGAVASLRRSLMFDKSNIKARNLLGLVYFEMGEVVTALSQWVISKNMSPGKNIADEYIEKLQYNSARLDTFSQTIKKFNRAVALCSQDSRDLAVIQPTSFWRSCIWSGRTGRRQRGSCASAWTLTGTMCRPCGICGKRN